MLDLPLKAHVFALMAVGSLCDSEQAGRVTAEQTQAKTVAEAGPPVAEAAVAEAAKPVAEPSQEPSVDTTAVSKDSPDGADRIVGALAPAEALGLLFPKQAPFQLAQESSLTDAAGAAIVPFESQKGEQAVVQSHAFSAHGRAYQVIIYSDTAASGDVPWVSGAALFSQVEGGWKLEHRKEIFGEPGLDFVNFPAFAQIGPERYGLFSADVPEPCGDDTCTAADLFVTNRLHEVTPTDFVLLLELQHPPCAPKREARPNVHGFVTQPECEIETVRASNSEYFDLLVRTPKRTQTFELREGAYRPRPVADAPRQKKLLRGGRRR